MLVSKNKIEDKVTFTIDGSLSLSNISVLYSEFLKNCAEFQTVLIKGENITDIDLSFVQLVHSLKKNKKVELNLTLNEEQLSILNIAGIKDFNK